MQAQNLTLSLTYQQQKQYALEPQRQPKEVLNLYGCVFSMEAKDSSHFLFDHGAMSVKVLANQFLRHWLNHTLI